MTDVEFEPALLDLADLALEVPPADPHKRILAATIARPRLSFRAAESWLVRTLFACMVWLTFVVETSVTDIRGVISRTVSAGVDRAFATVSNLLEWMALGVWFGVWISQLRMPPSRREIADR